MAWETFTITLDEVKNYLKVEHDLENTEIALMTEAAIETAQERTNRDFSDIEGLPAAIRLAILKTVAFWYENRADMNEIPASAQEVYQLYYKWPGV